MHINYNPTVGGAIIQGNDFQEGTPFYNIIENLKRLTNSDREATYETITYRTYKSDAPNKQYDTIDLKLRDCFLSLLIALNDNSDDVNIIKWNDINSDANSDGTVDINDYLQNLQDSYTNGSTYDESKILSARTVRELLGNYLTLSDVLISDTNDQALQYYPISLKLAKELFRTINVDSEFSSTSENPLQNKVITNRIEESTNVSHQGGTKSQLPTIGKVLDLISSAIAGLNISEGTDEKVIADSVSSLEEDDPILFSNPHNVLLQKNTHGNADHVLYSSDLKYDSNNRTLIAPHFVQTDGGNYYITSGSNAPNNEAEWSTHGFYEIYIQYDE